MYAVVVCPSVCLSVCHKLVMCGKWWDESSGILARRLSYTYHTLYLKSLGTSKYFLLKDCHKHWTQKISPRQVDCVVNKSHWRSNLSATPTTIATHAAQCFWLCDKLHTMASSGFANKQGVTLQFMFQTCRYMTYNLHFCAVISRVRSITQKTA